MASSYTLRRNIHRERCVGVGCTVKQRECLLELNTLLYEINITDETNNNSKIEKKILELSVLLIQHSDYAKERSSLVYFTGVLGYNIEWKQWRQPLEYTTILAGIDRKSVV